MTLEEGGEDLLHLLKMPLNEELIAGVDEVGRGCLFGPVFAGAVLLTSKAEISLLKAGLKDSKMLTAKQRKLLSHRIKNEAYAWALGQASAKEIDSVGIREATELAMLRALQKLPQPINLIFVDGKLPIRLWKGKQKTLIHGDRIKPSISAASVLAKESRDRLIKRLDKSFPGYGLEKHVGYGTKFHQEALLTFGATRLHRASFLRKILPS